MGGGGPEHAMGSIVYFDSRFSLLSGLKKREITLAQSSWDIQEIKEKSIGSVVKWQVSESGFGSDGQKKNPELFS